MEIVHEMSLTGFVSGSSGNGNSASWAQNRSLLPIGGGSNDEIVRISAIFVRFFHFIRICLEIVQSKEHASPPKRSWCICRKTVSTTRGDTPSSCNSRNTTTRIRRHRLRRRQNLTGTQSPNNAFPPVSFSSFSIARTKSPNRARVQHHAVAFKNKTYFITLPFRSGLLVFVRDRRERRRRYFSALALPTHAFVVFSRLRRRALQPLAAAARSSANILGAP